MTKKKNVGIIISTDDAEICFLALRCAIFHLMQQENVKIFFVDAGVNYKSIRNGRYNINKLMQKFKQDGGLVSVCANRKKLKVNLNSFFFQLITAKGIADISYNYSFRSIKTGSVYVRQFKLIS